MKTSPAPGGRSKIECPVCHRHPRAHWAAGRCNAPTTDPLAALAPVDGIRAETSMAGLWAVADAARTLLSQAQGGRIGSSRFTLAAERLELALARLPEAAWPKR